MAERNPEWPEVGDLIIATIETVTDYGAYAKIDECDKRGLLHVSEISSAKINRKCNLKRHRSRRARDF